MDRIGLKLRSVQAHWRIPYPAYGTFQCRALSNFLFSFKFVAHSSHWWIQSTICPRSLRDNKRSPYDFAGRHCLNPKLPLSIILLSCQWVKTCCTVSLCSMRYETRILRDLSAQCFPSLDYYTSISRGLVIRYRRNYRFIRALWNKNYNVLMTLPYKLFPLFIIHLSS